MKLYVTIGQLVSVGLPFSEVCMQLGVAGCVREVELLDRGMAQIYDQDGSRCSFPVTAGEAGVSHDAAGYYVMDCPEAAQPDEQLCLHGLSGWLCDGTPAAS